MTKQHSHDGAYVDEPVHMHFELDDDYLHLVMTTEYHDMKIHMSIPRKDDIEAIAVLSRVMIKEFPDLAVAAMKDYYVSGLAEQWRRASQS